MMDATELRDMADVIDQATAEAEPDRRAREWKELDAEHVRRATDPVLRLCYRYPGPSESNALADHDAGVLLRRLERLRDEVRRGGPGFVEVHDKAVAVQSGVQHLCGTGWSTRRRSGGSPNSSRASRPSSARVVRGPVALGGAGDRVRRLLRRRSPG